MCTENTKAVAETDSIPVRGVMVARNSRVGHAFVEDCWRHVEGLLSDADPKGKWSPTDTELAALANNAPLLNPVRSYRERRILIGEAGRAAVQGYFAAAPIVLNRILSNEQIATRHRFEAAKELRQAAGHRDKADIAKEKFVIHINSRPEPPLIDDGEHQ
jgi:hypothetical protein